jgi:hypothetical protein
MQDDEFTPETTFSDREEFGYHRQFIVGGMGSQVRLNGQDIVRMESNTRREHREHVKRYFGAG